MSEAEPRFNGVAFPVTSVDCATGEVKHVWRICGSVADGRAYQLDVDLAVVEPLSNEERVALFRREVDAFDEAGASISVRP